MKFIFVSLFVFFTTASFLYGRYSVQRVDRFNSCSQEVQDEIMADKVRLSQMRALPFEIVYFYVLGRTYDCAVLRDNK